MLQYYPQNVTNVTKNSSIRSSNIPMTLLYLHESGFSAVKKTQLYTLIDLDNRFEIG